MLTQQLGRFVWVSVILALCAGIAVAGSTATLITLASFTGQNSNGRIPEAPLIQGKDGNFYSTTYEGGANGVGSVFKISAQASCEPNCQVTTVYSFCTFGGCTDGDIQSLV